MKFKKHNKRQLNYENVWPVGCLILVVAMFCYGNYEQAAFQPCQTKGGWTPEVGSTIAPYKVGKWALLLISLQGALEIFEELYVSRWGVQDET